MTNRAQAGVSSVFHRAGVHDRAGLHLGLRPLQEHSAGGCLALRHHAGRGGHSCPRPLGFLRQAVKGPFLALVGMVALVIYLLGSGRYRSSSVERSSCCWCVLSSTDGRTGEG